MMTQSIVAKQKIKLPGNGAAGIPQKTPDIGHHNAIGNKKSSNNSANNQPYLRLQHEVFFNHTRIGHFFRSSDIMCVEFSATEVRLMHLIKLEKKYRIKAYDEIPFKKAAGVDSDTVMETIGAFHAACKTKNLKVVLVLGGPQVLVKTIKIPSIKREQIREAVYWKLKQEIPSFSDNDLWDFQQHGSYVEENREWLNILTVIAREKYVKRYINLLDKIQVYPKKVIVKPVALNCALRTLMYKGIFTKKNIILIDIGREATLLCFFRNGVLTFSNTLAIGSSAIDKKLYQPVVNGKRTIQIKAQKLEIFKRKYGIISNLLNNSAKPVFPYSQLHSRMIPELKKYVFEIRRAIQFYGTSYPGEKADLAFVTGPGANLKNLNVFLKNELRMEVCSMGLFSGVQNNGHHYPAKEFTACFGAACHKGKNFNLIPRIIRKLKKYKYWQKVLSVSSILLFSALSILSFKISDMLDSYKAEHDLLKMQYDKVISRENKYDIMLSDKKELEKFSLSLQKQLRSRRDMEYNLRIISALTPDNIVLRTLDFKRPASSQYYKEHKEEDGLMLINGVVINDDFSADLLLVQFISALQDLNYYSHIELLEKSKNDNDHTLSFKIKLELP